MSNGSDAAAQFAGKVAAITGGTQGLGEAAARLLAARGAAGLCLAGRNEDRGTAIAAALSESGCPTQFVRTDVESVAACRNFIDRTEARFGRLDVLVNCAGCTDRGRLENTTEEGWDRLYAVNVKAPLFLTQRAVEVMRRHGIAGAIVNIGSIVAQGGPPFLIPYSASKGSLMTLTRGLANTLAPDHIRINMLNIGWTNTPHEHVVQTQIHHRLENWLAEVSRDLPFGRLLEPAEIARAIAYLTSDESGMLTGAVIQFDQQIIGTMADQPAVHP